MRLIRDIEGKTIVQVKVPVCITMQMDESDAKDMTQYELCGLIDEAIDEISEATGERIGELYAKNCITPVRFAVERHWDELPVDELEITCVDNSYFEDRGEEE